MHAYSQIERIEKRDGDDAPTPAERQAGAQFNLLVLGRPARKNSHLDLRNQFRWLLSRIGIKASQDSNGFAQTWSSINMIDTRLISTLPTKAS